MKYQVKKFWLDAAGEPQVLEVRAGGTAQRTEFDNVDTYQLEVEELAGAILEGREPALPTSDALANARVIERIAATARL